MPGKPKPMSLIGLKTADSRSANGRSTDGRSEAAWKKAMAEDRIEDPKAFAAFMLGKTSRTFALNIQVLPIGLRRQILLAYLFCRMADTLEDDNELPEGEKIGLLQMFRGLFPPGPDSQARLDAFRATVPAVWGASDRWDRLLVHHCHRILPQLSDFPQAVVAAISACVDEMCLGMIDFTRKQADARDGRMLIESVEDLDRYCYYVAGTVGNMLCALFSLHSPLIGKRRAEELRGLSVSFGLGLQLTNILKDVQEDRARNVSFIPLSLLQEEHLTESSFLSPDAPSAAAARLMAGLIGKAKSHLEDAMDYSCLLPRMEPRLRLFCLWPLFMAAETLVLLADNLHAEELRADDFRAGNRRGVRAETQLKKISRAQVKNIVGRTSVACWSNFWLRSMFRRAMSRLDAALARAKAIPQPPTERASGAVSGANP
ncbi:MAG: squalene/phytoene synthase family protein [Fibrobacteria bacterium]